MSKVTPLYPDGFDGPQNRMGRQSPLELEGLQSDCMVCGIDLTKSNIYRRLRVCPRCRHPDARHCPDGGEHAAN